MKPTTAEDYRSRMNRVLAHLAGRLDDPPGLDELARIAHFSPFHFHRVFRAMAGESVGALLRRLRLERAARLLRQDGAAVIEAALAAGYGSPEAFSRAFQQAYGLAPSDYRRGFPPPRYAPALPLTLRLDPVSLVPSLEPLSGGTDMPVRIEELPERAAICLRHTGSYDALQPSFERLLGWTAGRDIAAPGAIAAGLSYDDPDGVDGEALRYDVCVPLARDPDAALPPGFRRGRIPGGRYAVHTLAGPYSGIREAFRRLFGRWLPTSGEEVDDRPCLQLYLHNPLTTPEADLRTELCVPLRRGAAAFLAALLLAAPGMAEPRYHAGYLTLDAPGDPGAPVSVWYPTEGPERTFRAGFYTIEATPNAPVAPGRHRLVVISHGMGASDLAHHDLAEHLARNGIVAAAPRHLGDSYDRPEGRGTDVQFIGRAWQVTATLDAVLADPRLAGAIDAERIGMAGLSAGGYTALLAVGAEPDFARPKEHCRRHPENRPVCTQEWFGQGFVTRPGWRLPHETRIKAAVAMAPFGIVFDEKGLAGITAPLRIYEAADDRVLDNRWNAGHVLAALPRPAEHETVPGGHYVFVAPCPVLLRLELPEVCVDPPGVDRAAIHRRINGEIVDFFDRTLGRD